VPKTCAALGANCGAVADGCGGIIANCGTCTAPQTCGGGGAPSVCGYLPPPCVNLACKQTTCAGGGTTSISGVVYDPAGKNPLPNVFVYVPNGTVQPLASGATCDKCADALSGYPLVTTTTGVDGSFTLANMPVGTNVPVVIQTGKWRRQITVTTAKCGNTAVATTLTRFPRNKSEGDIPKIAMATGGADPLECILRKIGIDDAEFTDPAATGRVNMYGGYPWGKVGQVNPATYYYQSTSTLFPDTYTLWGDGTTPAQLASYDMVLLGCEGAEYGNPAVTYSDTAGTYSWTGNKGTAALAAMQSYVNNGGRVFASHYHYYWLAQGPSPWNGLATWNRDSAHYLYSCTAAGGSCSNTILDYINTSLPKGDLLAQWLLKVGGATTYGRFNVSDGRHSVASLVSPALTEYVSAQTSGAAPVSYVFDQYASGTGWKAVPKATEYLSFNAPIGVASSSQCGKMVTTDIHVSSGDTPGAGFPAGCTTTTMTAQEKALEFLIFDLSSRVCDDTSTPPPPACVPQTCASQGVQCGQAADGCGGVLNCGTCSTGTCGGGGVAGKCGSFSCTPSTCAAQGYTCGSTGDGCGNILNCGGCAAGTTCGGGGTPGKCGSATCTPTTCVAQGIDCGSTGDGCGNVLACGGCTLPTTCGGAGTPGKCGSASCTPKTCATLGVECGSTGDGCGNVINCGICTSPATCGGGGTPGKCGSGSCTPSTCVAQGISCGSTGDGCGHALTCGTCAAPASCGGGGTPGKCGSATCTPKSCAAQGIDCGSTGDGCGNALTCGTCASPLTCGGGGTPGKCGAGNCTPKTCAALGLNCGSTGDGCGNALNCGTCVSPLTCGGGGVPGQCGSASCTPKTCAAQGIDCGSAGDGCGNVLSCGTCVAPATCGGGGASGKCGVPTCKPLTCAGKCGPQGDGCGGLLSCPACDGGVCTPTTCAAFGAECGQIGDGCGNVISCGTCVAPASCGGGGTPYKCGGIK
jgi:hypothetical protein